MKRIILTLILSSLFLALTAQDYEIVSVESLPADMSARKEIKTDHNNHQCALLRIATQNITPVQREGFFFETDFGSKMVERANRDGEIWLWVSPGLKTLRIKHKELGQYELHTTNYIANIESLHTYKITIRGTLPLALIGQETTSITEQCQYLVFQLTPTNAMLEVEGQLWEVGSDGTALKCVKYGTYSYRVIAPNHIPETGEVIVDDPNEPKTVNVKLKSDFVEVTFKVDADAEIWVNNEKKGTRTWTGSMGKGIYKIECKQEGHETTKISKEITAEMNGQTITLLAPKPIYGSLNVESTPIGTTIYIDGKEVGKTPRSINEILVGQHEIKLTKDGYEDYLETVNILKGERKQMKATLNGGRNVQFVCNAPFSQLKIDGQNMGSATNTYKLKDGRHSIKITASGYQDYSTSIDVDANHTYFSVDLQKEGRDVQFVCNAPYSQLKIDGQYIGSASGTYKLEEGRHSIFVTADGYHDFSGHIDVDANADYFSIDMRPETKDEETFTVNGVSFAMKLVEGGTFQMGSNDSEAYDNEKPVHSVTLSSYYLGETEVTQALWQAVMGINPSYFKGNNLPVEQVSWNDCQEFIRKLNQKTGKNFRLPTEAEWEYAARGGSHGNRYKYAGSNIINNVAWYTETTNGTGTRPVKTKSPNELGLYDMSGNVYEWCQDWYGSYSSGSQINPAGPSSGPYRVLRGGSWDSDARYCRVSYRSNNDPDVRNRYIGFRLCLPQ